MTNSIIISLVFFVVVKCSIISIPDFSNPIPKIPTFLFILFIFHHSCIAFIYLLVSILDLSLLKLKNGLRIVCSLLTILYSSFSSSSSFFAIYSRLVSAWIILNYFFPILFITYHMGDERNAFLFYYYYYHNRNTFFLLGWIILIHSFIGKH